MPQVREFWCPGRHILFGQRINALFSTWLLAVRRLEAMRVVPDRLDPALMEETLQLWEKQVCGSFPAWGNLQVYWDLFSAVGVELSPCDTVIFNHRALHPSEVHYIHGCLSVEECDDVSFHLDSPDGDVLIGLAPRRPIHDDDSLIYLADNAYVIWPCKGEVTFDETTLVYSDPFTSGVVRCVRDRVEGTISFVVNGKNWGVAFSGVGDEALYALAILGNKSSVELLS